MTLTNVGKSAGYSRGLPAHHFGSRENNLKAFAFYVAIEFDQTLSEVDHVSGLEVVLEITRTVLDQLKAEPTRGLATQIVLGGPWRDRAFWKTSQSYETIRWRSCPATLPTVSKRAKFDRPSCRILPACLSQPVFAGSSIAFWPILGSTSRRPGEQLLERIQHALSANS